MDQWESEARLLFAIVVAGKSEKFARKVIQRFLVDATGEGDTPLKFVKRLHKLDLLEGRIREARTGSYTRISKAFAGVADFDVATCTIEDLEAVHGIGPKTSRFYLMWTRPGVIYAALDRHVLRWMAYLGYDVPKNTPTGRKYLRIEQHFLDEAAERNMTPRDLDAQIWEFYSGGGAEKDMPANLTPKNFNILFKKP